MGSLERFYGKFFKKLLHKFMLIFHHLFLQKFLECFLQKYCEIFSRIFSMRFFPKNLLESSQGILLWVFPGFFFFSRIPPYVSSKNAIPGRIPGYNSRNKKNEDSFIIFQRDFFFELQTLFRKLLLEFLQRLWHLFGNSVEQLSKDFCRISCRDFSNSSFKTTYCFLFI